MQSKLKLTFAIILSLFLVGCYYGPGVNRVETNAVRRSVRNLDPRPVITQQSDAFGQNVIALALDSALTPLIMGDEAYQDPEAIRARDFDENMRRQQRAMDELDRELDEIERRQPQ